MRWCNVIFRFDRKNAVQIKELLLYANYDSHLCGFFILRFFARIERISYLDAFYPTWSRK